MAEPKKKADPDKKILEAVAKLVALQRDYLAKASALGEEIATLLSGGVGMGDVLKRLYAYYDTVWSIRYAHGDPGKYAWRMPQDAQQMKRLVRILGVEEVERRMVTFLRTDDPYFARNRHTFGTFVATINQHTGEGKSPVAAEVDLELDGDVAATKRRQQEMRK